MCVLGGVAVMGVFYGASSQSEIITHARRVCRVLSPANEDQAFELLVGTACAETGLATTRDRLAGQGVGLCQFDMIGFDDAYKRGFLDRPDIARLLLDEFDIKQIRIDQLEFSTLLSLIMCRLKYRLVQEVLPQCGDIEGQAAYWKKYYNTYVGKGTEKHYIESVMTHYLGLEGVIQ
jgi:hypothetical protein